MAALDPTITPALRREGIARELVSRVQRMRKEAGLAVSDRIHLGIAADPEIGERLRRIERLAGGGGKAGGPQPPKGPVFSIAAKSKTLTASAGGVIGFALGAFSAPATGTIVLQTAGTAKASAKASAKKRTATTSAKKTSSNPNAP